jgi:hypothetical protein
MNRNNINLTYASLFLAAAGIAHSVIAGNVNKCPEDLRKNLPTEISSYIPTDFGVESIAYGRSTAPSQLIAVVADPKWYFSKNYCESDSFVPDERAKTQRVLYVWVNNDDHWLKIEENESVVWPVDTAGRAFVSLAFKDGELLLKQESSQAWTNWSDVLELRYDISAKRMRLIRRAFVEKESPFNKTDAEQRQFQKAHTNDQRIANHDEVDGDVDYDTRKVNIEIAAYGKRAINRSIVLPAIPRFLEGPIKPDFQAVCKTLFDDKVKQSSKSSLCERFEN